MATQATSSLLAAICVLAGLAGQGTTDAGAGTRRPLIGSVVDPEGQPVAGAEVWMTLIEVANDGYRALDELKATTDARGRFRLDALPCAPYRGFALGPVDDQQLRLASEVTNCSTGALVELRCTERCRALEAEIRGIEAWQEHAPLSLRLAPERVPMAPLLAIPADGRLQLPHLPLGLIHVDVLDRDGQPLQCSNFGSRGAVVKVPSDAPPPPPEDEEPDGESETASKAPGPKPQEIALLPPQRIPLKVVDEQGQPLAGAVVRQRLQGGWMAHRGLLQRMPSRTLWRDLGTTDADGKLTAQIAYQDDPFQHKGWQSLLFLASMPDRMVSWAGWTNSPYCDGKEVEAEGLTELQFVLRPQEPLRGTVMASAGKPLAGQHLLVHACIKIEDKQHNGWTHESLTRVLTTDDTGAFTFADIPPTFDAIEVQLLSSAAIGDTFPSKLRRCAPPMPIAIHPFAEGSGKQMQIDLAQTHLLELQLLDKSRGPGSAVDVLLLSLADDDTDCTEWTTCATTDNAGRLALRLQTGKWLLLARGPRTVAHQELEITADQRLELQLEPMPAMRGRVVDASGAPLAGARLQVRGSSWSSVGGRDQSLTRVARSFNWEWIRHTVSDADGNFECAYLAAKGTRYEVEFEHAKRTSNRFQLDVEAAPITVTIE